MINIAKSKLSYAFLNVLLMMRTALI